MSEEREAFYKWCAQPKIIDDVAEAAWFAALEWQAARQSAGATGQHDGNPWLRVIMERDGWRNAMTGLCTIWPKTPDEAATHLRARLHPDRTAPISNNGAKPCTCHPDDNPPVPCAQKYAYSDCVVSQPTESEPTVLTDEELFALIKHADPRAVRIPPGIRAIADALFARAQSESARVPPERVTAPHWKKLAEVNQSLVEYWQQRIQSESKRVELTSKEIAEVWTKVSGRPMHKGSTAETFARALLARTQAKGE